MTGPKLSGFADEIIARLRVQAPLETLFFCLEIVWGRELIFWMREDGGCSSRRPGVEKYHAARNLQFMRGDCCSRVFFRFHSIKSKKQTGADALIRLLAAGACRVFLTPLKTLF